MDSLKIHVSEANEQTHPVKDCLNTTLKEMMSILKAECGSLFLLDADKKELVLKSFLNSQPLDIKQIKRRVGEGITGKVAENRTPILVKDIDRDIRFSRNGFNHYHTKSFISIPLICSHGLIGLINVADKATGDSFSEKDLQFGVTLAKYACAVVDHLLNAQRLALEKEKLNQQKAMLEKYASVGKLAAGVVHEVNNPLDGILRYTNMLLTQIHDHSVTRDYLIEIKKGLDRLANTTKSLLEFSHVVNADASKPQRYVDLHERIDDSLDALKHKFTSGVRIVKSYAADMPRLKDMGIAHVLINMIKNATDAMPQGGVLEIATANLDGWLRITFKDTGSGISSDIREKIFDPFFTTKSIENGTGLGLAISKEIVNKYEGKIEVQSASGQGTTFVVLIPKKYCE
jgi:signal transduction histidine kinase